MTDIIEIDGRWWRQESHRKFIGANGGLVPRAIGCRFLGRKPGTWRVVRGRYSSGMNIGYEDNNGRLSSCWISTFLRWVDKKQPVLVPDAEPAPMICMEK